MIEKEKIIEIIKSSLLNNPDVLFAYIFGSFTSKNNFRDIDIGIFITNLDDIDILNYEFEIEKRLEDSLNIEFDVRVINKAPSSFVYHILKNNILVVDRDKLLRADFENIIYKTYFDLQFFTKEYLMDVKNVPV